VGWGKVVCWSTKEAISLRWMKSYYGGPIETHQRSFGRYHSRPPMAPSLDWRFATTEPPKTPTAIISEKGKATDFKFGRNIHRVHPNNSPLKFWRKGAWAYPGTTQILGIAYYLKNGKSYEVQFLYPCS